MSINRRAASSDGGNQDFIDQANKGYRLVQNINKAMILMSCRLADDVLEGRVLEQAEERREDKWSHLYTVYHPHSGANRLYGFHLKYWQKSNKEARLRSRMRMRK